MELPFQLPFSFACFYSVYSVGKESKRVSLFVHTGGKDAWSSGRQFLIKLALQFGFFNELNLFKIFLIYFMAMQITFCK